jgi:hypothetical protein
VRRGEVDWLAPFTNQQISYVMARQIARHVSREEKSRKPWYVRLWRHILQIWQPK